MTFSPELEARLARLMQNYPNGRLKGALVPMLLFMQDEVGALTPEVVAEASRRLSIKPMEVEEVIGYYSMLHKTPLGRYHVQVCTNVSCLLQGGEELYQHACHKLGLGHKQVTADGQFSLEEVECLGACSWAPAVQVNYDFHHEVTPEKLDELIDKLRRLQ